MFTEIRTDEPLGVYCRSLSPKAWAHNLKSRFNFVHQNTVGLSEGLSPRVESLRGQFLLSCSSSFL